MARSGKKRRLLGKDYRAEVRAIQASASKRGMFSSIFGFLGGALATAVTGGAAAPAVAAMMGFGGNYLGRKLGAKLSDTNLQTAGGGKFAKGARYGLESQLAQQDLVAGLKGGLFAGIGQMGGLSGVLKGTGKATETTATAAGSVVGDVASKAGLNLTDTGTKFAAESAKMGILPKGTFGRMFKSADKAALGDQTGIGRLLDFRGSSVGKALSSKFVTNLKGDISTGFKNKSMDWSTLPEGMSPRDYQSKVADAQALAPTDDFWTQYESQLADDARGALGKPPSFSDVMRRTGQGGKKEWVSGDPTPKTTPNWRTDLQQQAVRLSNQGSGVTDRALRKPDRDYLSNIKKMDVPEFSASDAQELAIKRDIIPKQITEERNLPTGITWGDTQVDPGYSDLSYAVEGSPDFPRGDYTGDVPDLESLYMNEPSAPDTFDKYFQADQNVLYNEYGIEDATKAQVEAYRSRTGQFSDNLENQIYEDVPGTPAIPGTPGTPGSSVRDLPGRKDLTTQLMERGEHGEKTFGVYNPDTGQWEGALGQGRTSDTRADFLGGEIGPYIRRTGDTFQDASGLDYQRVNKYLQSDAYSKYQSDYMKANPDIPAVEGTPGVPAGPSTTRLTDTISADMTTFPETPVYTQPTEGSGSFFSDAPNTHSDAIRMKLEESQLPFGEGLRESDDIGTGLSSYEDKIFDTSSQGYNPRIGVQNSKFDLLKDSNLKRAKLQQDALRYERLFGKPKRSIF